MIDGLAVSLSDLHLVYRGLCKYSYLCPNTDFYTKGRKLLEHKFGHDSAGPLKHLKIELIRIEEYNATAKRLINIELLNLRYVTTESTTSMGIHKTQVEKLKDAMIKLHRVEEWNSLAKVKLDEHHK